MHRAAHHSLQNDVVCVAENAILRGAFDPAHAQRVGRAQRHKAHHFEENDVLYGVHRLDHAQRERASRSTSFSAE